MNLYPKEQYNITLFGIEKKQGQKRPLDTPERKIERKERDSDDGNSEKKSINNAHSDDADTKKYDRERERTNGIHKIIRRNFPLIYYVTKVSDI